MEEYSYVADTTLGLGSSALIPVALFVLDLLFR